MQPVAVLLDGGALIDQHRATPITPVELPVCSVLMWASSWVSGGNDVVLLMAVDSRRLGIYSEHRDMIGCQETRMFRGL